jgi:BirA family transcriptional regulator, biotin operon repressor / biotin---[acetyl-CoA-carboxylase] ligase
MWRSTALASVAITDAVQQLAPMLRASIKWPNDVLIGGRKVAGILAESTWDGTRASVIVGVGVNVSAEPMDLEGLQAATSLRIESRQRISRGELLRAFLSQLDAWLQQPEAELRTTWQSRLWGRGQRLRLAEPEGEFEVIVLGAAPDGSLRVRLPDGTERTTATGELIL